MSMNDPRWVQSIDALYDFISLVVVHAPDEFPEEDYLKPEQQLTLDKAFVELRRGMDLLRAQIRDPELVARLEQMLDASYASYRAGEQVKGAHLLQDFRELAMVKRQR
jgi:hypothetical protein